MKPIDTNMLLVEGYLKLLDNLNPVAKLDLIAKLKRSIEKGRKAKGSALHASFGAWADDRPADDIVREIRGSRHFNRKIEGL